ncbi:MAG: glycoside hydrolase [Gemmataceae bacterium]|nr:glycoside hydrolase [Gemmataceae bacterium]
MILDRTCIWMGLLLTSTFVHGQEKPKNPPAGSAATPVVSVNKIWDQAPHNAFTDLVRFQGRWFCVFREGKDHVSPDGALRVITSTDGVKWESAALITSKNSDLRDAKITVTPDGQLMLCGAEALHDRSQHTHQSLAWFSRDGRNWSEKHPIGDPDFWLWRVTWHKGTAYSIGYGCGKEGLLRLYVSKDGKKFETLVDRLLEGGHPNETSIVFEGDTAYCLLRRDGAGPKLNTALLGIAQAPYTKWEWKDLGVPIGGPHLIQLPDGRWLAAVRLLDKKVRTSLCWLDPKEGKLTEFLTLPSGGDTSYPGLVLYQDQLWISYYSSHEGKTSIYLAKMPLDRPVRDIGSRRELFVDQYLIERMNKVTLKLHEPCPAPPTTQPADNLEYGTVIKDGDIFRLYTRDGRGAKFDGDTSEVTRYCESKDGIHWTKPKLGLYEIDGTKENNVILHEAPFCHNFSPFLDQRLGVPKEERFKALGGTVKTGLFAFVSADGIHWKKWRDKPVITYTKEYAFDSQNVAFWSETEGCYVCYFRHFLDKQLRSVCRTTSSDFITWTEPVPLKPNFSGEHLYTTLTHPYFNAPHIYVALPTRFHPSRGESTDILFMTARGDTPYDRTFRQAFLRPGLDPARWGNRSNYAALNVVPTGPTEMSIYVSPFRRFTLRTDGFASVHAGADAGELLTRLLRFTGNQLIVNYSTSAGGNLRVEIQDETGQPIPSFRLEDCVPLVGDSIQQAVRWKDNPDLSRLAGKLVRLRFVLQDGDLYAIQFKKN